MILVLEPLHYIWPSPQKIVFSRSPLLRLKHARAVMYLPGSLKKVIRDCFALVKGCGVGERGARKRALPGVMLLDSEVAFGSAGRGQSSAPPPAHCSAVTNSFDVSIVGRHAK